MSASSRSQAADALRGLALLAMTSTHALRILSPAETSFLPRWLFLLEPLTPALFLLLCGWGLHRSWSVASQRGQSLADWKSRQNRRALGLWGISATLFFALYGPQWPGLLTSTGILQCIAVSSLLGVALTGIRGGAAGAGVLLLMAWLGLEARGLRLDGLNQGSFPLFPYVSYLLLGLAWSQATDGSRWKRFLSIGILGATGLAVTQQVSFPRLWTDWGVSRSLQSFVQTRNPQSNGFFLLRDLLQGKPAQILEHSFWITTPRLGFTLPLLCALLVAAMALLVKVPILTRPLQLAGRHSLAYYVGHLVCLGLFQLTPHSFRHSPQGWALATTALYLGGLAIFWFLEWRKTRKTP